MKTIYKAYPTWWYTPTLDNLCETHFYMTWKSHDYNGREDIFQNAQVLIIWNPVELENGKYIPDSYIWKIKNIGIVEAWYREKTDDVEFEFLEVIQWKKLDETEEKRLKKCILNQCYNLHEWEIKKFWEMKREVVYIEVFKPIPNFWEVLYKQKKLYNLALSFNENGEKVEVWDTKRYFVLTDEVCYDTQKEVFIKKWEEVLFGSYGSESKKIFLKTLLEKHPSKVAKETLFEALWGIDNKELLELKRSLLKYEFWEYLWLSKDFVEKNILIAPRGQGYKIEWEFFEVIPT